MRGIDDPLDLALVDEDDQLRTIAALRGENAALRANLTDAVIDCERWRARAEAAEERCRELCGGGAYT